MKSVIEKEKKLNLALTKLKNLNLKNPDIKKNIKNLSAQKNQLEIEKQELEEKYKSLEDDYNNLTKKLDEFQNLEKIEQKRQIEFSEKIDELNQETDTLLDEIDKWQT
jgi:5-formyltetrahydrofolate cyclo-ligase